MHTRKIKSQRCHTYNFHSCFRGSGNSMGWANCSMKCSDPTILQSCNVVPNASLSDLYSLISLTLWNVHICLSLFNAGKSVFAQCEIYCP